VCFSVFAYLDVSMEGFYYSSDFVVFIGDWWRILTPLLKISIFYIIYHHICHLSVWQNCSMLKKFTFLLL